MEITIKATKVQKVSVRSKYDDDKLELTTTLQADMQLHPSDIARIVNLLVQKVPLYLTIGSLQAQFDLEMLKIERQPEVPEQKPAAQAPADEVTRVVMLSEDAALHTNSNGSKDFLSLHYNGLYLGPFVEICPPVDQLKQGAMLKLTLDRPGGAVIRVELAEPKDIANQHLASELEQELFGQGERVRVTVAPKDDSSRPKRRGRKVK